MRPSLLPRRRPIPRAVEGDRRCQPDDRSERPRQTQPHCRGRGLPQARTPTPRTWQTSSSRMLRMAARPSNGPPTPLPSKVASSAKLLATALRSRRFAASNALPISSTRSGVVDSSVIRQPSIPCAPDRRFRKPSERAERLPRRYRVGRRPSAWAEGHETPASSAHCGRLGAGERLCSCSSRASVSVALRRTLARPGKAQARRVMARAVRHSSPLDRYRSIGFSSGTSPATTPCRCSASRAPSP